MFTLSLLHARITHILSLTLDSLLNPSTFAFAFTIIYPQSPSPFAIQGQFLCSSCYSSGLSNPCRGCVFYVRIRIT